MIARKFTDLDRSMARVEFLADKHSPLTWLQVAVRLKRSCKPSDLGFIFGLRARGRPNRSNRHMECRVEYYVQAIPMTDSRTAASPDSSFLNDQRDDYR
jgi:hypothetical protein